MLPAILALGLASPAGAAPITFAFEGTLSHGYPPLFGDRFEIGDLFSGWYTFEGSTPDGSEDPTYGAYPMALSEFSITIGDYTVAMYPSGYSLIEVNDVTANSHADNYIVTAITTGEMVNGQSPRKLELILRYPINPEAISGDQLPLVPPDISLYRSAFLLMWLGPYEVRGILSSLTLVENEPVAVSEPLVLPTLGAGLAAMAWIGRRQKRGRPDRVAEYR
jgi:hypothetical protein